MADDAQQLSKLLAAWSAAVTGTSHPHPPRYDGPDAAITRFTEKTSEVEPGVAFVARVRTGSDGHPYIGRAIERGASLILAQRTPDELGLVAPPGMGWLTVPDTAEALAWLSAAREGFPSRELVVIGITGTDGKTTTANILFAILRAAGVRAGLLSTIKADIGGAEELLELHVTTPESPVVQRYLRRMADVGLTHCVLETTSHALAQHRVAAVAFDVAVVTNITHEHLDYHGSAEAYFAAKRQLFAYLLDEPFGGPVTNPLKARMRVAVLNRDDRSFAPLDAFLAGEAVEVVVYGVEAGKGGKGEGERGGEEKLMVSASDIEYGAGETALTLHVAGAEVAVRSPLAGAFNVYNMLAATAAAAALGVAPEAIRQGLEGIGSLSGRMERIDGGQPFLVVVDFAHTPNALERAIAAARGMVGGEREQGSRGEGEKGRVIAVFGSAGKRDVEKRRLMAGISIRAADLTVLTAEDPRTESLDDILAMMSEAATAAGGVEGETFWRVPDRGQAIRFALELARPGDVVLLCGKGHEQSMCFGTVEYPWDDRAAARAAIAAWTRGEGMVDLGLPTFE